MQRMYSMKNVNEPLGYGKYSSMSLMDLILLDPKYIDWMGKQDNIWFSDTLSDFFDAVKNGDTVEDIDDYIFESDFQEVSDAEFDIYALVDKYTKLETNSFSEYVAEKEKKRIELEKNRRMHEETKRDIPTDDDLKQYVWKYFATGKMEQDTKDRKLHWKALREEKGKKNRKSVFRTKLSFGSVIFYEDATFNDADGKWYATYQFLIDESISLRLRKTEMASPVTLKQAIYKNL